MTGLVERLRAAGCVFAEDEARLLHEAAADAASLEDMVRRRVAGDPLEQILGWAEFAGLRITVEPGVFVPRRRTELIVDQAVLRAKARSVVVDLCCGTGALGRALLERVPTVRLSASDLDPAAVRCARRNLAGRADVYEGDLFAALPVALRGRVGVLMANAPYVPTDAIASMPREARDHEARLSLDGGPDGLSVLRRIIAEAPAWLAPGGALLFETSELQRTAAAQAVREAGLHPETADDDEIGGLVLIGIRRPDAT